MVVRTRRTGPVHVTRRRPDAGPCGGGRAGRLGRLRRGGPRGCRVLRRGSCGTTGASGNAEKASDCSSQCRSSGRRAMKVPTYGTGSLMPSTVGPFGSAVGSDFVPESQTNPAWDLLVDLDAVAAGPLHERLKRALRAAIRSGRIPAGATLPPSRVLAGELGCSRWAVTEAYAQLIAEGYLDARTGSGTRVRWVGPASCGSGAPRRRAHPGPGWTWLRACRTSGLPTRRVGQRAAGGRPRRRRRRSRLRRAGRASPSCAACSSSTCSAAGPLPRPVPS